MYKLRISTIALFVPVRQSACKNLAPPGRIVMVFGIADLFNKMSLQFGLYWNPTNRIIILREDISRFTRIILGLIKFQVTFVEKIKISCSYEAMFSENPNIYEKITGMMTEPGRSKKMWCHLDAICESCN
jgi:hypothetical protein